MRPTMKNAPPDERNPGKPPTRPRSYQKEHLFIPKTRPKPLNGTVNTSQPPQQTSHGKNPVERLSPASHTRKVGSPGFEPGISRTRAANLRPSWTTTPRPKNRHPRTLKTLRAYSSRISPPIVMFITISAMSAPYSAVLMILSMINLNAATSPCGEYLTIF